MIHTFAPALRRRVDWRVWEIRFRLEEERKEGKGKSRKKYLIYNLDEKNLKLIFVVPKQKRESEKWKLSTENVLWNY